MANRCRVTSVKTSIEWPTESYAVQFEGYEYILRPSSDINAPDILLKYDDNQISDSRSHQLTREFMSTLVWLRRQPLSEFSSAVSSLCIEQSGPSPYLQPIAEDFELNLLPQISHPKAKLALAIYREAMNINSTSYKYLGFWKIIGMLNSDGSDNQIKWIADTLQQVQDARAIERYEQLKTDCSSISDLVKDHLYGSRRCAIAHAFTDTINPDNPEVVNGIGSDLYIVKALAEYAIEHEFKVETEVSLYKKIGQEPPARTMKCQISRYNLEKYLSPNETRTI